MKHISKSINILLRTMDISYHDYDVKDKLDNIIFSFNKEAENEYFKTIEEIWKKDKELYDTLSYRTIADKLDEFLKELIFKDIDSNEDSLNAFFKNLKLIPLEEKVIFKEIHGIRIDDPIKTNGFELYNINNHRNILEDIYPQFISEIKKGYIQQFQTNNIICYKVITRDYIKAQEIALEHFKIFENVLSFFISNPELNNKIRISDSNIFQPKITIVISKTKRMTTIETGQFGFPNLLVYQLFEKENFQYLIKLVTKKNKSGMESRIATAIDWASHGLKEDNKTKTLIYFVFAIESLLKYDEKGIIKPAIVSQISEMIGFILGNTYESRVKYSKMFNETYEKRSEVVHYGKDKVTISELNVAFFILKSVIMKFIEDHELIKMKSIENFYTWYKVKKFS